MAQDPVDRVRALCLALPEASEKLSHGEPTWFVRKKVFVSYANQHHDDIVGMWCAAPPGVQEELVGGDPEKFYRPPYVGHRGWLGVRLDVPVDWTEIAEIITDAYRVVAPKKLLAELDAGLVNGVRWPKHWQQEAIAAVSPYLGTEDRLEIVVGDPRRSVHGSVITGHLYLISQAPVMIHDRSGRLDAYPWVVLDGPVLRAYLVRPRRKKLVLYADERWRPPE